VAAQVSALVVTVSVLVGLIIWPEWTLRIAWFGIVPLLPASFLLNVGLWRGVCPIATANTLGLGPQRTPNAGWLRASSLIGVLLLLILVPMRRLILNVDGLALAGTLVLIVAASLVLGLRYRTKAGFCNSLCPILPVEKLYGQAPLVWIQNPRCLPCDNCSIRGCVDLNPAAAAAQPRGPRSTRTWLKTPMGVFAMAFPGLVLSYFQLSDGAMGDWFEAYGLVGLYVVGSYGILASLAYLLNPNARTLAPISGSLAIGIYYWYAAPASIDAFGGPAEVGVVLRWLLLALIAFWLSRALRSGRVLNQVQPEAA
jgi:hypothetical protein